MLLCSRQAAKTATCSQGVTRPHLRQPPCSWTTLSGVERPKLLMVREATLPCLWMMEADPCMPCLS